MGDRHLCTPLLLMLYAAGTRRWINVVLGHWINVMKMVGFENWINLKHYKALGLRCATSQCNINLFPMLIQSRVPAG